MVLPDMDVTNCRNLAVPMGVMQHVVRVESSFNRYAIGVVGGRLVRQPVNLPEALATARMLRERGFNFSLGLAQVNRYNLGKYGLSLESAFQACPNLQAGARILSECLARSGHDWGKSLSCYYSGNFVTGFRQGYVQKVFASMQAAAVKLPTPVVHAIPLAQWSPKPIRTPGLRAVGFEHASLISRRIAVDADGTHPVTTATATRAPRPAVAAVEPLAGLSTTSARVPDASHPARIDKAFVF